MRQRMNQSVSACVNESIRTSTDRARDQSIIPWIDDRGIDESVNDANNVAIGESMTQPTIRPMTASTNGSIND